jgi:hypothetical protein
MRHLKLVRLLAAFSAALLVNEVKAESFFFSSYNSIPEFFRDPNFTSYGLANRTPLSDNGRTILL